MSRPDIERAVEGQRRLYTESLAEHGIASKAVGWKDEASQRLRFDKLVEVVVGNAGFAAGDWGCGYGAMFDYLDERFGPTLTRYEGYDISEEMVSAAHDRIVDPRARFVLGSNLGPADYAFVSGTFNVRFDVPDDAWETWIEERLRELAAAASRGIAFNLLTSYVDWREPHLYYGDPARWFDFCMRELSRSVVLLHDYPLYEWTILVRS